MSAVVFQKSPCHLRRGFTMFEVMITMIIVVIVAAGGYMSLSGLLPRVKLDGTGKLLATALSRAQREAYTRNQRVGVTLRQENADLTVAEIWPDDCYDPTCVAYSQDAAEKVVWSVNFRPGVQVVSDNCNPMRLSETCGSKPCKRLYFNGGGQAVTNAGVTTDYEIIFYNPKLETGTNAREVEVLATGMVQLVELGQAGSASGGSAANTACPP